MRPFALTVLAGLLCAGAVRAQGGRTPGPPPPPQKPAPPPLSKEDAELVKELVLLERMELVRNLELFQPAPDGSKDEPQRQP